MKKTLFLFILAVLSAVVVFAGSMVYDSSIPSEARSAYSRGVEYSNNRDYNRAITEYSRAISIYPNFQSAYSSRGFAYYRVGNLNSAIADYEVALQLNPNDNNTKLHLERAQRELHAQGGQAVTQQPAQQQQQSSQTPVQHTLPENNQNNPLVNTTFTARDAENMFEYTDYIFIFGESNLRFIEREVSFQWGNSEDTYTGTYRVSGNSVEIIISNYLGRGRDQRMLGTLIGNSFEIDGLVFMRTQ